MRKFVLIVLFALPLSADTTVTLLHFSDYHSHALPFAAEEGERGGIARAIRYLRAAKRDGALVFSGGDTINKGAPAWSDKYGCAEWSWFNGIVDAMAFGNHDADYGYDAFVKCRAAARYPILSANTNGFRPYAVFTTRGARIGVFAVAGNDFAQLVNVPQLQFGDSVAAAREAVRALREQEHVDAVVMIGHEHAAADEALARSVPGIDLIFGTHSHLKRELTRIEGSQTWFISPWQYLGYISRVSLTIADHRVTSVRGGLVPVDASMREDRAVAKRVKSMQRALERDPQYAPLFAPIATLKTPMSVDRLAALALTTMRRVANADIALSTKSSFRLPLAAGTVTLESLRASMPYDNEIVVCTLPGAQLQRALDAEMYADPAAVDPSKTYRVVTTDYVAGVAYRNVFQCEQQKSGLKVREQLIGALKRR
ncbi:MAG TPA: 5'-nucleotidase C-terminal domain-containing protein [Thermoanaerobaculia bacterium]|jgi:5'-nucleotidase